MPSSTQLWTGGRPISNNTGDYIFFLSKDAELYGCFSNAYREKSCGHLGLHNNDGPFWCVNQELHYRKAILFGDKEVANLVLVERDDAAKIKQYGREVKNYDDEKWTELRYFVARDAVEAKFRSDDELKKILLETEDKIIVEAATDRAWGIGVVEFSSTSDEGEAKKGAKNKDNCWNVHPNEWNGLNLLGRCLMDVREGLMGEYSQSLELRSPQHAHEASR